MNEVSWFIYILTYRVIIWEEMFTGNTPVRLL